VGSPSWSSSETNRTKRSSERAPAGTPSGDADVAGSWPPSLTFTFGDIARLDVNATVLISLIATVVLSGCGFVHDEHLTGPYRLIAVDTLDQMGVSYGLPGGNAVGRIPETVFSVGWNSRYLVAKQHPKDDRSITHFYYLDVSRDSTYADPSASVTGPLSESEFLRKRAELGLPEFSRTIKSLQ
jgi:hypothetical protein